LEILATRGERACILSSSTEIAAENFPVAERAQAIPLASKPSSPEQLAEIVPETVDLRGFMTALEKALIQRALKASNGAQAEAARRLGLSRSDVSYKLGKHNIRSDMS